MKRVASLYLPDWPIDRLRRAERTAAPPEARSATQPVVDIRAAPRDGGWRPGARWARGDEGLALRRLTSDDGAANSSPGNRGRGTT